MLILGVNAHHADSAAVLIRDGVWCAGIEEERLTRTRHWAGFPRRSIAGCLKQAGAVIGDVDAIAINTSSRGSWWPRICHALAVRPSLSLIKDQLQVRRQRMSLVEELTQSVGPGFQGQVHRIDHHLSHLASAWFGSGFDHGLCVSMDGFGDFASTAWGAAQGADLAVNDRIEYPHSLGIFYQAMTQFLGFHEYGDEYKVMGLASFGSPRYTKALAAVVSPREGGRFALDLRFFRHHRDRTSHTLDAGQPVFNRLFSRDLEEILGPPRASEEPLSQRYRDIAASVQQHFEDIALHVLGHLQAVSGAERLCLAGGCAQNSVLVGKIRSRTGFRKLNVPAAASDAGGAFGAAALVAARNKDARIMQRQQVFVGPSYDDPGIERALHARREALADCVIVRHKEPDLLNETVDLLQSGAIVGWFQGAMEWGPRALGGRSILADPRNASIRDRMNACVKSREDFRPFAPAVPLETAGQWFSVSDAIPFMTEVVAVLPHRRSAIPAVTHVDGTARVQSLTEADNGRFYRLVRLFGERTGVPILLNTSFNRREPIVCSPDDALESFLRAGLDALIMENTIITRAGR